MHIEQFFPAYILMLLQKLLTGIEVDLRIKWAKEQQHKDVGG